MLPFLDGALCMASAVAALFFLRFWRHARERLFAFFAAAFVVLAMHWALVALVVPTESNRHDLYVLRFLAFALIAAGVVDKNRRRR